MTTARRTGFTLIETVAAIVILAVAVPPMLWAVTEAQRQRINPMLASRARWLAVEKLEDVVADRHSTTRGYAYLATANYAAENPVPGSGYYAGFTRSVTFLETKADLVTTSPAPLGYMTVTVIVGWNDADLAARTLDISTVLTDYTP